MNPQHVHVARSSARVAYTPDTESETHNTTGQRQQKLHTRTHTKVLLPGLATLWVVVLTVCSVVQRCRRQLRCNCGQGP